MIQSQEIKKQYGRTYRETHKEHVKIKAQEYEKTPQRKAYKKRYREEHREFFKDFLAKWHQNKKDEPEYRRKRIEANKRFKAKYPKKVYCVNVLGAAVRYGKIKKPNKCSMCKRVSKNIQAHHPDYSKPLDVIWVCIDCHNAIHSRLYEESSITPYITTGYNRGR